MPFLSDAEYEVLVRLPALPVPRNAALISLWDKGTFRCIHSLTEPATYETTDKGNLAIAEYHHAQAIAEAHAHALLCERTIQGLQDELARTKQALRQARTS